MNYAEDPRHGHGVCTAAGQEGRTIPPNKKTYQQDPANYREALREAKLDEAEGADIMMVKPGMPYLDIIRLLRDNTPLPVAAYHVSGTLFCHCLRCTSILMSKIMVSVLTGCNLQCCAVSQLNSSALSVTTGVSCRIMSCGRDGLQ